MLCHVRINEGLRHSLPFQHGGKQCCFGFRGASLMRQLPKLRRKGYCITHFGCCITRKPRESIQVCVNVLPTSYRQVTDTLPTVGRLSADCRPTVGQLSANCRSTGSLYFGQNLLADSRPTGFLGSSSSQLPRSRNSTFLMDHILCKYTFFS